MPGLAGQSRDYLMSANVISKSPNSLALGVPLIACTRRAAPETGRGGLVYHFAQSLAIPIPDTGMLYSLLSNQKNMLCFLLCLLLFADEATPC